MSSQNLNVSDPIGELQSVGDVSRVSDTTTLSASGDAHCDTRQGGLNAGGVFA